jgi:malonate-semialdehyde dehydrogenase (acetylating)/methylmalonate-semialdehyde dehydrogenase
MSATAAPRLRNFINGTWHAPAGAQYLPVVNPATAQPLAEVPLSPRDEVRAAVDAGSRAFRQWRFVPANDRAQFLYRFKARLESHLDELARTITDECGKTLAEATAEIRRGIENVEVACGIPSLLQGWNNEQITPGIDEHCFRQPLGVVTAITPFNFPAMIPLWFLPYAIACGNCFILKPSEKVPRSSVLLFELLEQTGLPAGVAQLLHGSREVVEGLIDHEGISAVSFVGSTGAARQVYARAAANGKRVQCQGGAKNPVVILPDADLEQTTQIVADSAFGCAGQRCLAASLAITVGEARQPFREAISEAAHSRRVGYGAAAGVQMGPVISAQSRERISGLIDSGCQAGARPLVDGRTRRAEGDEEGFFLCPTVLDQVDPKAEIARTEVFGPVLSLLHADDLGEAIALINQAEYGNMASLFTRSGGAARRFRAEVEAGNIGINIGVAAPMAYFPFSGAKASFLGDLHAQGRHGVEFYTQTKVVVERWPG